MAGSEIRREYLIQINVLPGDASMLPGVKAPQGRTNGVGYEIENRHDGRKGITVLSRLTTSGLLIIGLISPAFADATGQGGEGHMHWMGGGWSHAIFGPIVMPIALAAVVILVLAVVRSFGHSETPRYGKTRQDHASSALELIRERFARGEIDAEEFKARLALLDQ